MNVIVKKHYPVEKLPADLREGLPEDATAEVQVVPDRAPSFGEGALSTAGSEEREGHFSRFFHLQRQDFRSTEEIVEHVRALRDEWDRR